MHECYFSFLLATRSAMLGLAAFLTYQPRTAVSTMAVSHRLLSSTPTNKGRETSGMMHRWEMAVAAQGVPVGAVDGSGCAGDAADTGRSTALVWAEGCCDG